MVQFITHYNERYSYLDSVRIALEGGCRWIQLRMKDSSPEEILPIAEKALAMCREHNATFIIDDHVELAKQIKADGVHLGKLDMPIAEARRILGKTSSLEVQPIPLKMSRLTTNPEPTTSVVALSVLPPRRRTIHPYWVWKAIVTSPCK